MIIFEEKGIIPYIRGGIGNQLFIVVASYISAKQYGCPVYLIEADSETNPHNIHNIKYNDSIFKYFGKKTEFIKSDDFIYYCLQNQYRFYNSNLMEGNMQWSLNLCIPGTIMNQYYQYYPPIEPHENEIRTLILNGLHDYCKLSTIQNSTERIFIHVRRGDYLNYPDIHYNQPIEYYKSAMEILNTKNPKINEIMICSDDLDWVKEQSYFKSLQNAIFFESPNELYTLLMMSKCHGGAICANSTFSWWGAFLGAYSVRNPVIVPKKWISFEIGDLFPRDWIHI